MEYKRIIPENLNHPIISSVFTEAEIKPKTEENYIKALELIEAKWENYLIDLLNRLNINASVKPNKYSLPFKDELIFTEPDCPLFPKAYYAFMFALREFVKVILERNLLKLRFYIIIELHSQTPVNMGRFDLDTADLTIRFRYYGN